MRKTSFEKLDDGFVNIQEEGIFINSFEFSGILISELTGYRLYANIDKKTGFIFLECGFPKNKMYKIVEELERKGFSVRIALKEGRDIGAEKY